jgi:hypothetical protein
LRIQLLWNGLAKYMREQPFLWKHQYNILSNYWKNISMLRLRTICICNHSIYVVQKIAYATRAWKTLQFLDTGEGAVGTHRCLAKLRRNKYVGESRKAPRDGKEIQRPETEKNLKYKAL